MTKQHLGIFAIVAVSLILGIPPMMADATKPTVSTEYQTINGNPSNEGDTVCGLENVAFTADVVIVTTTYPNGNTKSVETWTGEWFTNPGLDKIGTIDQSWTVKNLSDKENGKGADTISKKRISVTCLDGTIDNAEKDVTVSHRG